MNFEDVINKYKDEAPKKIEYYIKLFAENGVNENDELSKTKQELENQNLNLG